MYFLAAKRFGVASRDFRARVVNQQYLAFQVRSQQTAAHRFDDVLIEGLQVLQLFTLRFQFNALLTQCLRQQTAQICHSDKREEVAGQPGIQNARRGVREFAV